MYKITPYTIVLLLSAYISNTVPQNTNDRDWASARLQSMRNWRTQYVCPFSEEQLLLVEKLGRAFDRITMEYKNEENKVTIALSGLSDIVSAKTVESERIISTSHMLERRQSPIVERRHIISTSSLEINIGLDVIYVGGKYRNYISISRTIYVPQPQYMGYPPTSISTEEGDFIDIPVLKQVELGPLSKNQIRPVLWNVLSVSAEQKDNKYIITFDIEPQAGPIELRSYIPL